MPNNQMPPCEQALGNGGKKNLSFNRKKPQAELGTGRGGHLPRPVGGEGATNNLAIACT